MDTEKGRWTGKESTWEVASNHFVQVLIDRDSTLKASEKLGQEELGFNSS